jgi:hypothetical protein
MNRTFIAFLKGTGWAITGLLALIGIGTLIHLYFEASSEVPVGVSAQSTSSTQNPAPNGSQPSESSVIQFDAPTTIWGTRYLVIPIGLPNQQYSSELKRRARIRDDNTRVNVAILNDQTQKVVLVFDRPLAIGNIDVPRDSSHRRRRVIVYTLYSSDSDSNGVINSSDNAVLFTSAFDGTASLQITPDSLSVLNYHFVDHDARLRIKLAKRSLNKDIKAEAWEHSMLWYDFGSKTLSNNKDFDAAIIQVKQIIGR